MTLTFIWRKLSFFCSSFFRNDLNIIIKESNFSSIFLNDFFYNHSSLLLHVKPNSPEIGTTVENKQTQRNRCQNTSEKRPWNMSHIQTCRKVQLWMGFNIDLRPLWHLVRLHLLCISRQPFSLNPKFFLILFSWW